MSWFSVRDFEYLDWRVDELFLQPGEVVAVMGESGSGKSLFLRAISDLIVSSGLVEFEGVSRESMRATEWRRKVGYLPAEILWWEESVADHFLGIPDEDTLARLKLKPDVLEWETSRLSMGERQRLGLLRLLDRGPSVLLLDEPTSNLDEVAASRMEGVILDYAKRAQAGVVWVTHSKEQAERVASRRFEMADKKLKGLANV
ncbi:MAG: ATP-binding cassette domain-containing protein [Verrucomicrobiota bacterium]